SAIGGTFDGTNIIADIPNQEDLKALNEDIKAYLNGEIDSLDGKLGKQIETVVNQAKDEFSVAIDSVDKKIDGIEVGGRNLLPLDKISIWSGGVTRDRYIFNLKTDNKAGLIIDRSLFEPKTNYILSYKIKVLDGLVYKLGGHSIGKTQIKTVLDGVQLTGDYHQGIKVELSEGWHNVEYHFYFSGDKQDNLYIQPNRAFYQNYYE